MKTASTMEAATALSQKLSAWQEREKINQPEAARRLAVPFGSYRNWVKGRNCPGAAALAHIDSVIDTDYTENRGREQKEVAFAYASSPDAERLGYAATGCWTVSTGKGYTLRARKAFVSK